MRLVGTFVVAGLVVAFAVQTAVLMKTRSRLGDLEERLGAAGEGAGPNGSRQGGEDDVIEPQFGGRPNRRPPPEFVAAMEALGAAAAAPSNTGSGDPLPLPPALATPEAREQLKNFVTAVMQQQREEQRDRARQQREEGDKQARARAAERLGLSGRDAQQFDQILSTMSQSRQELMSKLQAGQIQRGDIGREMGAIRQKTDDQLKQLLGDQRFTQFQEVQREVGLGMGRGGGGWRGGGGPPQPATP